MTNSSESKKSFFVSAPGKVILFGEHAVVHEKAAVATSVSLRSFLFIRIGEPADPESPRITLNFPDIKLNHSWPASSLPPIHNTSPTAPKTLDADLQVSLEPLLEPFTSEFQHAAVLAFLYLHASLAKPATHDVTFLLRSAIPIGSGLGSSASISVCLATALLYMADYIASPGSGTSAETLTRINEWAYLGERCIHGNPSGVDNTVATFGGGVVFRKERPERRMTNGQFRPHKPAEKVIIKIPALQFLLTDTNHPRRTATLVAHVAKLLADLPHVTAHILTAIDGIAAEAKELLESEENVTERLGELIEINQGLLNSVGVGHAKLDTVAKITKNVGWTKLTGAGGGGCALTLLHEGVDASAVKGVEKDLIAEGFKPFEVELGGDGVAILEDFNQELGVEFGNSIDCILSQRGWRWWT